MANCIKDVYRVYIKKMHTGPKVNPESMFNWSKVIKEKGKQRHTK